MASEVSDIAGTLVGPAAVSVCPKISTLTKRADFVRTSNARRQGTTGVHLQARKRMNGEATGIRVGYTCSKKVGNAVARNRAKRRLREIARMTLPTLGRDGWDYVLVGRNTTTGSIPFQDLLRDLHRALAKVHA
ncbi:MAG: ribonuclease P protein component [Yoonia sp.]|jgi:ribonuclease P protein component